MRGHDGGKHLTLAALHMVAKHLWAAPDYGSLSEEEKARCDALAEAYVSKCEAAGAEGQHLGPL